MFKYILFSLVLVGSFTAFGMQESFDQVKTQLRKVPHSKLNKFVVSIHPSCTDAAVLKTAKMGYAAGEVLAQAFELVDGIKNGSIDSHNFATFQVRYDQKLAEFNRLVQS